MKFPSGARRLLPFVAIAALACTNTEEPAEDHVPATFRVLVNGVEVSQPYTFIHGTTVRVQLKFFNAASEDLDDVEASHFAGLTFTPTSIATIAPVTDHHFQFDLTPVVPGSGTVTIGYGHDTKADEHSFPNLPVVIQVAASSAP